MKNFAARRQINGSKYFSASHSFVRKRKLPSLIHHRSARSIRKGEEFLNATMTTIDGEKKRQAVRKKEPRGYGKSLKKRKSLIGIFDLRVRAQKY